MAAEEIQMVLISWHDGKFSPGPHDLKDITALKMSTFSSLGHLVLRDDVTTVIAAESSDDGEYRDVTLIPTKAILSMCRLTLGSSM